MSRESLSNLVGLAMHFVSEVAFIIYYLSSDTETADR